MVILAGFACGDRARDPRSVLPGDAEVFVSFPEVDRMQREAGPFFDRLPQAAGVVDWLRSLSGMDLRSALRTREEGWDPRRPFGAAFRGQEWWIALPVDSADRVRRRVRLRLARLGLALQPGAGPGERYQDPGDSRRRAWVLVEGDLARVCLSLADACRGEVPPAPSGTGLRDLAESVARESGLSSPGIVLRVSGEARKRLVPEGWRARLPSGMASDVFWGAVGDLRGVVQWQPGPVIRILAGTVGDPVRDPGESPPLGSSEVAAVALDLGPWMTVLRQFLGSSLPGIGAAHDLVRRWDGRLRLSVGHGEGSRDPGRSGTAFWRERFPLEVRLGLAEAPDQTPIPGGAFADGAGTSGDPAPGGEFRVRLPGLGDLRGIREGRELRLLGGAFPPSGPGATGTRVGLSVLPQGMVIWARLDWYRVVSELGGASLGLPGHLAAVVQEIRARVFVDGGRLVAELRAIGRQEGGR